MERHLPVGLVLSLLAALCGADSGAAQVPRPRTEPADRYVVVGGHRLWYRMVGRGEPLLVIPGGPGGSHTGYWRAFERLAPYARVVFFDAFGRGKSDRASDPKEYSFAHDVDEVEGLRKALGLGPLTVYGHSYGSMVAQGYALKYPTSVRRLILADAFHSAEMWQVGNNDTWNRQLQDQMPDLWARLKALRDRGVLSCDSAYQRLEGEIPVSLSYYYDPSNVPDSAYAAMDLNLAVYCQIAGPDVDVVLGGDLAALDFRPRLHELTMPVLVLAGRFDRVSIPRFAFQYRELLPQATFVLFEHSGHAPFAEEPVKHDSVVRAFLRR